MTMNKNPSSLNKSGTIYEIEGSSRRSSIMGRKNLYNRE